MLVQVNETTWLRHDEIKQICISRTNYINEHRHCISVVVQTDLNDCVQDFDTLADAKKFAARLANYVNFEEAKTAERNLQSLS